jgi:uncharacterized DUF497 family protein
MSVFEWNTDKANGNLQKHKISFDLARLVFDDPFQIILIELSTVKIDIARWVRLEE